MKTKPTALTFVLLASLSLPAGAQPIEPALAQVDGIPAPTPITLPDTGLGDDDQPTLPNPVAGPAGDQGGAQPVQPPVADPNQPNGATAPM